VRGGSEAAAAWIDAAGLAVAEAVLRWWPWLVAVAGGRAWWPWLVAVAGGRGWWPWPISAHCTAPVCRQQNQGLLPPGTKFDLFRGAAQQQRDEVETYPSAMDFKVRALINSSQQPAASSQQPAASSQQPAARRQAPGASQPSPVTRRLAPRRLVTDGGWLAPGAWRVPAGGWWLAAPGRAGLGWWLGATHGACVAAGQQHRTRPCGAAACARRCCRPAAVPPDRRVLTRRPCAARWRLAARATPSARPTRQMAP
jgi:hypothetical protein